MYTTVATGSAAIATASIGASVITNSSATHHEKEAARLYQYLNTNKEQMSEKTENLKDNVSSIIPKLGELEGFWGKNIIQLERFIEQFQEPVSRPRKLTLKIFEKRWMEVIKECGDYSIMVRNEIEHDERNLDYKIYAASYNLKSS